MITLIEPKAGEGARAPAEALMLARTREGWLVVTGRGSRHHTYAAPAVRTLGGVTLHTPEGPVVLRCSPALAEAACAPSPVSVATLTSNPKRTERHPRPATRGPYRNGAEKVAAGKRALALYAAGTATSLEEACLTCGISREMLGHYTKPGRVLHDLRAAAKRKRSLLTRRENDKMSGRAQ